MVSRTQKIAILFFSFIVFGTLLSLNFINRVKSVDKLNSDVGAPATVDNTSEPIITRNEYAFDLEVDEGLANLHTIVCDSGKAHSGKRYCLYDKSTEYGVTFLSKVQQVSTDPMLDSVYISMYLRSKIELHDIALVLSVESENNPTLFWDKREITGAYPEWTSLSFVFAIPNVGISKNDVVKVFVWNEAYLEFMLDDLQIKFY